MVVSMTGFAIKTIVISQPDGSKAHLTMTLKSLNARFFEVTCKLPYALQYLETEFIRFFKTALHRGHVSFTIQVSNSSLFKGPVEPSLTTVNSYVQAIQAIQKACSLPGTVTINDIINLPNIFSVEEKAADESVKEALLQATQELIKELITARKTEGALLQQDLEQRCTIMHKEIVTIEQAAEKLMNERKKEAADLLTELAQHPNELIDAKKHLLYHDIDKNDIHEEIVRFNSHLGNLKNQITSNELEKGRRLDFTIQELVREINTIGAKCSDVLIGTLAINIKVELEKIREQIQNIV